MRPYRAIGSAPPRWRLEFDRYIRMLLGIAVEMRTGMPQANRRRDDVTAVSCVERIKETDASTTRRSSASCATGPWARLATIAASVGILAHYLATRPVLQQQLREQPTLLPQAIDEILRIHAPLIANSRGTTTAVEIAGRKIEAGERITVIWASANRDETVFGDPDEFRPDRPASQNLLYGAGIHVCPGAPLARLELRIIMEELLAHTPRSPSRQASRR